MEKLGGQKLVHGTHFTVVADVVSDEAALTSTTTTTTTITTTSAATSEVVTTHAATETEIDVLRYPTMEPAFKLACDKTLSFRREHGGRVPTGGPNATRNEGRLANLKSKLRMRCSRALGAKPSERQLSAEKSAYFEWCISDEEQARQGNPRAAAPVRVDSSSGGHPVRTAMRLA